MVVNKLPVDGNTICQTLEQAQQKAYDGYSCYVKDLKSFLQFIEIDGVLQIKEASGYEHPTNHPASMITEETNKRFLTDAERTKLGGIAANANNYTHPVNHPASIITQDSSNRFVSDTEKAAWSDKYSKNEVDNKFTALTEEIDWKEAVATFADIALAYPTPEHGWVVYVKAENKKYTYNGTSWVNTSSGETPLATNTVNGLMSANDKSKLDAVATNANNYTHPANHPASIITEETNKRFLTDAERTKLGDIAANANNYTHPTNHPASIITEETNKRFLTDAERTKLSGIAANANNYTHPANHPASIITQDSSNRFVSDTEKAAWNGKADSNHTHTDYVVKSGDTMTGALTVNKNLAAPIIKATNNTQTSAGAAAIMGDTPTSGKGYLGVFINSVRAGVMGIIGAYSTGTTNWAGYFDGRTKINGKLAVGDVVPDTYEVDIVGSLRVSRNLFADSDRRLKKNIKPIINALSLISRLQGVKFNWRKSGNANIGLIAQDVAKVLPEVVSIDDKGFYSMDYGVLTAVLIQAINEQQKQINELEERL